MVGVLRDVFGENKSLLEAAINLAQFPEDQEKENRDYEQPELDIHFSSLKSDGLTTYMSRRKDIIWHFHPMSRIVLNTKMRIIASISA
jgi:hypothetical protein